jgi:hypothetical protein
MVRQWAWELANPIALSGIKESRRTTCRPGVRPCKAGLIDVHSRIKAGQVADRPVRAFCRLLSFVLVVGWLGQNHKTSNILLACGTDVAREVTTRFTLSTTTEGRHPHRTLRIGDGEAVLLNDQHRMLAFKLTQNCGFLQPQVRRRHRAATRARNLRPPLLGQPFRPRLRPRALAPIDPHRD